MCKCKSYNHPEIGSIESINLNIPAKFNIEKKNVYIDSCIVDIIKLLWEYDIWTLSSCCGHNGIFGNPSIVFDNNKCALKAKEILNTQIIDNREFDCLVWKLIKV